MPLEDGVLAPGPMHCDGKRIPVWVKWVDSSSRQGWCEADSRIPLMTVETIGWLMRGDEDSITIALNGVFDGSSSHPFGHLVLIPRCAIRASKVLDDGEGMKWLVP